MVGAVNVFRSQGAGENLRALNTERRENSRCWERRMSEGEMWKCLNVVGNLAGMLEGVGALGDTI